MPSLIYICTGNVCRSPFAEGMSRRLLSQLPSKNDWQVSSLGTHALSGHPMDTQMAQQLQQRGVDSSEFLARQATFDRLEATDLVIAMATVHRDWVLQESPALLSRTFTLGQAVRFAQEAGGAVRGPEFLDALRTHRSRARRRDDIADPYRRGPAAAAESARSLSALLEGFVPRLIQP